MVKLKEEIRVSDRDKDDIIEWLAKQVCKRLDAYISRKGYALGGRGEWDCTQYVKKLVVVHPAYAEVSVSLKKLRKVVLK